MDAGWTVVPSIILEKQHALGLDAIDVNILLQLARYWWFSDNPPHPTKASIAECIGVDQESIRRGPDRDCAAAARLRVNRPAVIAGRS